MSYLKAYLSDRNLNVNSTELLSLGVDKIMVFREEHNCDYKFFKALFADNYPDLLNLIITNTDTEEMVANYAPRLFDKYGNDAFWELLYFELISLNDECQKYLEKHLNAQSYNQSLNLRSTKLDEILLQHPFIMVFLGQFAVSLQLMIFYYDKVEYMQYIYKSLNKRITTEKILETVIKKKQTSNCSKDSSIAHGDQ